MRYLRHLRFLVFTGLVVATSARAQSTVFNETWSQGTRGTQNPPTSLQWFATLASSISQTPGSVTINASRQLAAFFPARTVEVGGTLTLSFTFSVAGPLHGNADIAGFTSGLRWGLFSTEGNPANAYTADGQNGNLTSTGYMAMLDPNADPAALNGVGLRILKRYGIANTLTTSSGMVIASATNALPAPLPLAAGVTYRCLFTVRATTANSTVCSYTITGPGLPDGYTIVIDDDGSLVNTGVPATIPAIRTFDTVAFAIGSSNSIAGVSAWTLGPVSLTYTAPGAPGTITAQPSVQSARLGGPVSFGVVAAGTGNSYQWKLNGEPITGATNSSYTIPSVRVAQSGGYTVTVSNGATSTTSNSAALSVLAPNITTLNPAVPPGQNFDLTRWGIQLPIKTPEDSNGRLSLSTTVDQLSGTIMRTYTAPWFYSNPGDGAMRFYVPITGDRLGSEFPRSELRELYTTAQTDWFDSLGTSVLNATLRIHQVPDVTKSVIIGQIKSVNGITNVGIALLRYQGGAIFADVGFSPQSTLGTRLMFPRVVGATPTELIAYELKTVPGAVFVTVNGVTQSVLIDESATGWPTAGVYFKAGAYCQGNPSTEGANAAADDGASTAFHALNVTHVTSALRVATNAVSSAPAGVPYSFPLQATNSSGALTWSLVHGLIAVGGSNPTGAVPIGALPAGLSLSREGVISGTPDVINAGKTFSNIVVEVTDASGASAIQTLSLAITAPPNPGRLINLSILTTISASDPSFTVGTVIGGDGTSGPKALLIRAAGPALAALGVGNPIADPKLDVFSGQTIAASNDNWGGTPALAAAFTAVGAFGFTGPTSRDAAVFNPAMPPGGYTVQVSGVGGATGTVIAELYDSTPAAAFTPTTPRLVNVSVLKQINAGEILTAGFAIGGTTSKQVLIRAIGPTLGAPPFNVGGTMPDPKLDLFSGSTVINSNDNWGGGAPLAGAFVSVGAFALGNPASRDAALLATLAPGNYTVQVSGVGTSSGLTLVEVYEVP